MENHRQSNDTLYAKNHLQLEIEWAPNMMLWCCFSMCYVNELILKGDRHTSCNWKYDSNLRGSPIVLVSRIHLLEF